MKTNNKGFSLVELIVVIAIMAILAAVAIPTFAGFIQKANIASDVSFVNDFKYAAELAHAATGDEVSAVKVTVDANGNITGAEYTVNGKGTVTIEPDEDDKFVASCSENSALVSDAQIAADTMDWGYTFKNYKGDADGTAYQLGSTNKTLE